MSYSPNAVYTEEDGVLAASIVEETDQQVPAYNEIAEPTGSYASEIVPSLPMYNEVASSSTNYTEPYIGIFECEDGEPFETESGFPFELEGNI